MFKIKQVSCNFSPIWRVFISGSSSAGKTFFAKKLLQAELFNFKRIYYFHPDIHEDSPTDWESEISEPICYQAGLPTAEDLMELPPDSCIVLDDLFREAAKSKDIDYLFRVLSGKRKLHVIIMTQRYFAEGPYALSIRNSSNYHVLMNNADRRINYRAADTLGLKHDYLVAEKANKSKLYPHIFIDQTNEARVTGLQVYTDILSKHREVILNSMLGVWISKTNFCNKFEIVDQNTAKYVDKKSQEKPQANETDSETEEGADTSQRADTSRRAGSSRRADCSRRTKADTSRRSRVFKRYLEKRRVARAVEQTLQKRRRRTKL